jgi:hypothetical protein
MFRVEAMIRMEPPGRNDVFTLQLPATWAMDGAIPQF